MPRCDQPGRVRVRELRRDRRLARHRQRRSGGRHGLDSPPGTRPSPSSDGLDLSQQIAADPNAQQCYVTQWFRYGYGRLEGLDDICTVEQLDAHGAESGYNIQELLVALTKTRTFRYRAVRGDAMNRRFFLKGALGAVVGLPVLPSLVWPQRARAGGAGATTRFITSSRAMASRWSGSGPIRTTAPSARSPAARWSPLQPYAGRLLLPRGIHMVPRGFGWDPGGGDDHGKGMGCKLTAQELDYGSAYAVGESVDQYIARNLNQGGGEALTLVVGWRSNSVLGHISYRGNQQPVTGEGNPWYAYQDFMNISDVDQEAIDRLFNRRQSVLDLVGPEYEYLMSRDLSQADRDKLDMHFQAIRDLEVTAGDAASCARCRPTARPSSPTSTPARWPPTASSSASARCRWTSWRSPSRAAPTARRPCSGGRARAVPSSRGTVWTTTTTTTSCRTATRPTTAPDRPSPATRT